MPTYRDPETGDRRTLGGSDVPRKARALEERGWVLVRPRGYNPWSLARRDDFTLIDGISVEIAQALQDAGYLHFEDLAAATDAALIAISGIGRGRLEKVRQALALMAEVEIFVSERQTFEADFAENGLQSVE